MAISRKAERELIRKEMLQVAFDAFEAAGYEVMWTKSNEFCIPVVGCELNEDFFVITGKVPTGANKGLEPYDGYAEAEDYQYKLKEKEEKAKKKAEEKKKKIEKDEAIRQKKREIADKKE